MGINTPYSSDKKREKMEIFEFIKKLLPSISKDQISEDLRITIANLENQCLPTYGEAANYFKSSPIKAKKNIDLERTFYKNLDSNGVSKQINIVSEIHLRLGFIKENALYVQDQLDKIFERDVITEGITVKQTHYVRAAEAFYFIANYSLDLLKYIIHQETENINDKANDNIELSKFNIKLVEKNINDFAMMLSNYGVPKDKFQKLLTEVPDVVINSSTIETLSGIYKERQVDPFTKGLVSNFTKNPIFHIRTIIAEYQNNKYKSNKEKKKELDLRLLYLNSVKDKELNPVLEKEIMITQQRVDKLDSSIIEYEQEIGLI